MNKDHKKPKILDIATKQVVTLWVLVILLICVWSILSFLGQEQWIPRLSLWADLVFGTGSFMLSFAAFLVSFLALKNTKKEHNIKIEQSARSFLIQFDKETNLLPLCLIANAFDRHHKYCREIYNAFNLLDDEIQDEVLKQTHYANRIEQFTNIVNNAFDRLGLFYNEYDFGTEAFIDIKDLYFQSLFAGEKELDQKMKQEQTFDNIYDYRWPYLQGKNIDKVTAEQLIKAFLYKKTSSDKLEAILANCKPIDYIFASKISDEKDKYDYCLWSVITIDALIKTYVWKSNIIIEPYISLCSVECETLEDRVLLSLGTILNFEKTVSSNKKIKK